MGTDGDHLIRVRVLFFCAMFRYHFFEMLSNSIFDEFLFTCIEKIGFGICQMAAKHVANP